MTEIHHLLASVALRKWWVLGAMFISSAAMTAIAFLSTPIYRADVVVAPTRSNLNLGEGVLGSALGQFGGLASLAGINLGNSDADTEQALAVLRSRQFTETFIRERNLMPKIFQSRWDAERNAWRGSRESWPTLAKAAKVFDRKIRHVIRDRKTGLITLQIDWSDRLEAASWANDLIKEINLEMRRRAISNATASVSFLEEEFQSTSTVATREAIGRLIETQVRQRMLATVNQEYAFRVVSDALPPDRNDRLRPRKLLLIAAGPGIGMFLAISFIIFMEAFRFARPNTAESGR